MRTVYADWREKDPVVLIHDLQNRLKTEISKKRYLHSVGVMETAAQLAERFGGDCLKASLAGLLHDVMREKSEDELLALAAQFRIPLDPLERKVPVLLHGPVAACVLAGSYGIDDEEIRQAVYWHTSGCSGMVQLAKIVFIADAIEPGRDYEGVREMRRLAQEDLTETMLFVLKNQLEYQRNTGKTPHPQSILAAAFELEQAGQPTRQVIADHRSVIRKNPGITGEGKQAE